MLSEREIQKFLQTQKEYLHHEYGVRKIGLFGSYARGEGREESDIDLLVEFDRPVGLDVLNLLDELEEIFGRKVDILTSVGLENIRIDEVREDIQREVVYV